MYCEKYKCSMGVSTCIARYEKSNNLVKFRAYGESDPGCSKCTQGDKIYLKYIEDKKMENTEITHDKKTKALKKLTTLQHCPKCKKDKPADADHFYNDRRSKSGLSCWCKKCQKASSRDGYNKKAQKRDNKEIIPNKKTGSKSIKSELPENTKILTLDFSEYELLFEDILAEASDQFRTPAMQVLWLASKALYKA